MIINSAKQVICYAHCCSFDTVETSVRRLVLCVEVIVIDVTLELIDCCALDDFSDKRQI